MTARKPAARRALQWLGESPDAQRVESPTPASRSSTTHDEPAPTAGARPRKSERRAARRAAFYADRRHRAANSPRALFEVAADQVRALDNERALTAATKALDAVIARYGT